MVIGSNCCALDLIRFHVKCLFVNRVINKNVAVCWLCNKCSHCDKMPYYKAKKKWVPVIVQCILFHRTWDSIWFLVLCNRTTTRIFDNYVFWMSPPSINFNILICKYFTFVLKNLSGILLSKHCVFLSPYFSQIFLVRCWNRNCSEKVTWTVNIDAKRSRRS